MSRLRDVAGSELSHQRGDNALVRESNGPQTIGCGLSENESSLVALVEIRVSGEALPSPRGADSSGAVGESQQKEAMHLRETVPGVTTCAEMGAALPRLDLRGGGWSLRERSAT